MSPGNSQFGIVIVGDEILSGKRSDSHLSFMTGIMRERGDQLAWARVVGDDIEA